MGAREIVIEGRRASGDWLIAEELFERGDTESVEAIRAIDDAEALGAFAPRWVADRRPKARALLYAYLDLPLNTYRHEALVRRAFKAAESAGDNALMARFLVAFDRSLRRIRRTNWHYEYREVDTEAEANALAAAWAADGLDRVSVWQNWRKK